MFFFFFFLLFLVNSISFFQFSFFLSTSTPPILDPASSLFPLLALGWPPRFVRLVFHVSLPPPSECVTSVAHDPLPSPPPPPLSARLTPHSPSLSGLLLFSPRLLTPSPVTRTFFTPPHIPSTYAQHSPPFSAIPHHTFHFFLSLAPLCSSPNITSPYSTSSFPPLPRVPSTPILPPFILRPPPHYLPHTAAPLLILLLTLIISVSLFFLHPPTYLLVSCISIPLTFPSLEFPLLPSWFVVLLPSCFLSLAAFSNLGSGFISGYEEAFHACSSPPRRFAFSCQFAGTPVTFAGTELEFPHPRISTCFPPYPSTENTLPCHTIPR